MLKLFKSKHHSVLGIDLSSTSVRILELAASDTEYTVMAYGSALLPEKSIESNVIKDIDKVAETILKVLATTTFVSKQAVIAVPDATTISKVIQLDKLMNDADMEEVILLEADKYIPFPIDEVNIDFNVIGPNAKNDALVDVLVVGSKSENITNRVDLIQRVNLEVKIVDVESFAIERAARLLAPTLPSAGEKKNIAIIDLGATYTHLYVLHDMKIVFTHDEEFGGKQLIDSIMQNYNMQYEDAMRALEQESLPTDYADKVLHPFKELILLQVKRALQLFFSASNHSYVDHIVLAGGLAKLYGIAQLVQESINIPTIIANPIAKMDLAPQVATEVIMHDSPKLMIASGLAIRGVSND